MGRQFHFSCVQRQLLRDSTRLQAGSYFSSLEHRYMSTGVHDDSLGSVWCWAMSIASRDLSPFKQTSSPTAAFEAELEDSLGGLGVRISLQCGTHCRPRPADGVMGQQAPLFED